MSYARSVRLSAHARLLLPLLPLLPLLRFAPKLSRQFVFLFLSRFRILIPARAFAQWLSREKKAQGGRRSHDRELGVVATPYDTSRRAATRVGSQHEDLAVKL